MFPQSIFDDFRDGRLVLVTGAGVSTSARNRFGRPIIGTSDLAATVASAVDLPYEGEDIKEVFEAARSTISTAKLAKIFTDNFVDTIPGDALADLFSFPWKRCYTFNVDDTIENIPRYKRVQRLTSFNALKDRRVEWRGYDECQIVHLHGSAKDITDGLIFSGTDYADAASRNPAWYSQLGEDFIDYTVVFLGTSLNEHILFQTIRSALTKDVNPGRSFCIIPGKLSTIKSKAFEARGISHIEGTQESFVAELQNQFPDGFGPRDVQSSGSAAGGALRARFTDRDVEALRSIFPISQKALNERFPQKKTDLNKHRRRFYEGYGATWPVISSESYAKLGQFNDLSTELNRIRQITKIAVVVGEAGAGKSTFVMHYGLQISNNKGGPSVFEYREGSVSFREAMVAFKRYREDRDAILLIDDLHVIADEIAEVVDEQFMDGICIITSARVGEWNDKIGKFFGARAHTIALARFKNDDIAEIIRAIGSNFAAPSFNKLPADKKYDRFSRSKQQLLIAMLEATEAKGFKEIIEDEFSRITDHNQRQLFLVVALTTVPRVGVSKAMASSILSTIAANSDFDTLAQALQGIIDVSPTGRYQARHQVYALEIIQKHASFSELVAARKAMINYYARYAAPIIKHISAHDGQLFRYLLNNAHIFNMYDGVGKRTAADQFYSTFEITLQLDGHFWLQYALLLRRLGRQSDALEMLGRSIQAYPANLYAQHALAQQKLIVAARRKEWSAETRALVSDAVATLLQRHHSMGPERTRGAIDEYPIVALGHYHIDALMAHNQTAEAVKAAKTYFREIDRLDKSHPDEKLQELKGKLLNLVTSSQWRPLTYRIGQIEYN